MNIYLTLCCISLSHFLGKCDEDTSKPILRYGFQITHECKSFEKAFLCVKKCFDLKYDVAHSDRNCNCKCFHKKGKEKYRPKINPMSAVPTTKGLKQTSPSYVLKLDDNNESESDISDENKKDSTANMIKEISITTSDYSVTVQESTTEGDMSTYYTNSDEKPNMATESTTTVLYET